jgi:hypothetical protein
VLEEKKITRVEWKIITFQFIKAFSTLQKRIPGICHNDTHLNNVILVPNTRFHVCYAHSLHKKKLMSMSPFLLRIIDFDLLTQPAVTSKSSRSRKRTSSKGSKSKKPPSSKAGEEFFPFTLGNTMVDFYRFAASANVTMKYRKDGPPSYWKEWKEFVLRYLPPAFIYEDTHVENLLTLEYSNGGVPTEYGGIILQDLWGPNKPSGLLTMLDDPYFEELQV